MAYFDAGFDAVAGLARLNPRELRTLPALHRARLSNLRRYDHALGYLKAMRDAGSDLEAFLRSVKALYERFRQEP